MGAESARVSGRRVADAMAAKPRAFAGGGAHATFKFEAPPPVLTPLRDVGLAAATPSATADRLRQCFLLYRNTIQYVKTIGAR